MKKFLSLILIILIISIEISPVFAITIPSGVIGQARNEAPNAPAPPSRPDAPPTNPIQPPEETTEESTVETIIHTIDSYEYIKGNVVEDLGELYRSTNGDSQTEKEDSSKATIPIKDVLVQLYKGDELYEETRTDEYGNWEFNDLPDDTYTVKYYYGYLNGISSSDTDTVKNILKYNGQDYLVSQITAGGDYTQKTITDTYTQEIWEITQSGNAATQVMIVLDCSYSMRTEEIDIGNGKEYKLNVAAEAAKKLINKLLDGTNNIYIGLVFFSGENYRAVSLTKNESELTLALDDIVKNDWYYANTDVYSGLDKAMNSFVKENENKYMVLISDGFPTKAGNCQIYQEDSESEVENKLIRINQDTRNKLEEILKNKIKFISLFTLADETEEDKEIREWVRSIYGDFGELEDYNSFNIIEDNGNKLNNTIDGTIKKRIEKDAESHEKEETTYTVAKGYEDLERLNRIKSNFSEFNYYNTSLFKIIRNYEESEDDIKKAIELSKKTYGIVVGGSGYVIEHHDDSENTEIEYKEDTDGDGIEDTVTKIEKWVVIHTGYEEMMALAKRPTFLLGVELETTAFEVNLQNGTHYTTKEREVNSEDILIETMEEELAYGSEVIITYTGEIKNETRLPYKSMQLICYLPDNVRIKEPDDQQYSLIEVSTKTLFDNKLISEQSYSKYKDKKAYILTFDESTGFNGSINTYEFKIRCSTIIKTLDDLSDVTCACEIFTYSNVDSRRMTQKEYKQGIEELVGIYPANGYEVDWTETRPLSIIPPTGLTRKMVIKNRVITTLLIVFVVIAIILSIILFKMTRKNTKKRTK